MRTGNRGPKARDSRPSRAEDVERRSLPFLLLACGLACAPAPKPGAVAVPPKPGDNLVLTVRESVDTPEEDTTTYGRIFLNGEPAGRTELSPKSAPKRWGARLPEGNQLLRFEVWDSTGSEPGDRRADDFQPRERFFRVEAGLRTLVDLKFRDKGRAYDFEVARESLP